MGHIIVNDWTVLMNNVHVALISSCTMQSAIAKYQVHVKSSKTKFETLPHHTTTTRLYLHANAASPTSSAATLTTRTPLTGKGKILTTTLTPSKILF